MERHRHKRHEGHMGNVANGRWVDGAPVYLTSREQDFRQGLRVGRGRHRGRTRR